jgi:tetrahydromethanopterin S-methyltransferase subunit G
VSTFMLLFPPNGVDIKTVTAMSILFAWVELLFLVGNHPLVSIYRTMFTHVSWNFFKILLWLFWFVFSTGLAFSFLLHYEMEDGGVQKNEKFRTVWDSVFKTIVMSFSGEIDFGDIKFSTDFKKFFFVLFIFFVFLVLVNLLNGLAISDISVIQKESKVTSLISRLEAIYRYEQVLMVPWISHALRTFYNICHCICHLNLSFHKDTHFLLSNSTKLENKTAKFGIESSNWACDDEIYVEEAILREAKAIYDRTAEKTDQRERMKTMEKQMKATVDKLDKMDTRLDKVDTRLDKVDTKLDKVDTRLDKVDTKLDKVDTKLNKVDTKLDEILQAIMAAPPVGAEARGAAGLLPG